MIEWLNDNSGAVQTISVVLLVFVTMFYALITWSISSATKKQAATSARMATEMSEQRLAADQPLLILDIRDQKLPDYFQWEEGDLVDQRTGWYVRDWPIPSCTLRVHNAGRGPAISIEAAYLGSEEEFYGEAERGFVLAGETREIELSGVPLDVLEFAIAPWEKELLARLGAPKWIYAALVYDDIHERTWISYLSLEHSDRAPWLVVGEQKVTRLNSRGRRMVTPHDLTDEDLEEMRLANLDLDVIGDEDVT